MLKSAFMALALTAGIPTAFADAIPMPQTLTDDQRLLMGVWQEDAWARPRWGHSSVIRTLAIANRDMTILTYGGIGMSSDFNSDATKGSWTAVRIDVKTIKLTLSQGEGRGTDLTLVFDSPDGFALTDAENVGVEISHFHRVPQTGPTATP